MFSVPSRTTARGTSQTRDSDYHPPTKKCKVSYLGSPRSRESSRRNHRSEAEEQLHIEGARERTFEASTEEKCSETEDLKHGVSISLRPKRGRSQVWTRHLSSRGILYYFNSDTGESRWKKPYGFDENRAGNSPDQDSSPIDSRSVVPDAFSVYENHSACEVLQEVACRRNTIKSKFPRKITPSRTLSPRDENTAANHAASPRAAGTVSSYSEQPRSLPLDERPPVLARPERSRSHRRFCLKVEAMEWRAAQLRAESQERYRKIAAVSESLRSAEFSFRMLEMESSFTGRRQKLMDLERRQLELELMMRDGIF